MQLLFHQIKRELSAHQGQLIAWIVLLVAQMIFGLTGLGGEFYGAHSSPMSSKILMLIDVIIAIGIVLLPAAIAITDPPTELSAQWRTLPIRPRHLLSAKLLTILGGIALPFLAIRILTLVLTDASTWSGHAALDFASNMPAWMLLGFCFGALAGNWKRFAIGIACLLVGNMMLLFVVNTWTGSHFSSDTPVELMILEKGLENFFTNNILLLGSVVAILLRYFTRLRGELLAIIFLSGIPATIYVAPQLTGNLIPDYRANKTPGAEDFSVNYDLPIEILVVTNNSHVRWHGHVPYSGLRFKGVEAPHFLLPIRLDTWMWAVNDSETYFAGIGQDWFRFPGRDSLSPWLLDPAHFMERHLTLPRAVPDFQIINPPYESGDGFRLFNLEEQMALRNQNTNLQFSANLTVRGGSYIPTGTLPLTPGSTLSSNGTTIRISAWLPDAGDKTQIKVKTRHVQFPTESDNIHERQFIDPRRRPSNLRYVLVNGARSEACLPVTVRNSYPEHVQPLSFQSTVLDFSIADGPDKDLPIDPMWLAQAELHIYRATLGRSYTVTNRIKDIDIFQIPRKSLPKEIKPKYR